METHVWGLVREWMESQQFPPTQAAVARHLGVQRSAVSQWKKGQAHPTPGNLRAMATMTGVAYELFLDALLRDQGYLRTETYDAAPNTASGQTPDDSASDSNVHELRRDSTPEEELDVAAHPKKGRESEGRRLRRRLDEVGEESQDPGEGL